MTPITLIFTYYKNRLMLLEQIKYWQQYPDGVRIIVVDDGSPTDPAIEILRDHPVKDLSLYRIEQDIELNTIGARNLGFYATQTEWNWSMDMDHLIPVESISAAFTAEFLPNLVYVPARQKMLTMTGTTEPLHRNQDIFIARKELFWQIGGYDERFVGYYHYGPFYMFRKSVKSKSNFVKTDPNIYTLYCGLIPDASPITNRRELTTKQEKKIYREKYNRRKHLLFKWTQVI